MRDVLPDVASVLAGHGSGLVGRLLPGRKTAARYLRELERSGILVGEKRGREVIYRHPALLEVLPA